MRISRDECKACVNNTGDGLCPYQVRYVSALAVLDTVLDRYKDETDWFGSLRARCDYYVEDADTMEETGCCCAKYTWKDIVRVHEVGCFHYSIEEFPISGKKDGEHHYQLDDFIKAVAQKYGVPTSDVDCYMLDSFDFPSAPGWDISTLGCYIFGKPEWVLELEGQSQ